MGFWRKALQTFVHGAIWSRTSITVMFASDKCSIISYDLSDASNTLFNAGSLHKNKKNIQKHSLGILMYFVVPECLQEYHMLKKTEKWKKNLIKVLDGTLFL